MSRAAAAAVTFVAGTLVACTLLTSGVYDLVGGAFAGEDGGSCVASLRDDAAAFVSTEAAVGPEDAGADGQSVYAAAVLADAPLSYWRLGDAVTPVAKDSASGRHDGVYKGGVTLGVVGAIANDPDTAVAFDGQ